MKRVLLSVLALSAVALVVAGQLRLPQYPLPRFEWRTEPVLHTASARDAGMDSAYLFHMVDSIITRAIAMHAFPGCQLFVAREGKVVIDRSWGHHDYNRYTVVQNDHLYDLASVTKVAAATLAAMKLVEEDEIGLDDRFSKYYLPFRNTDKRYMTIRQVMTHTSGLPALIPMMMKIRSEADSIETEKKLADPKYKRRPWDELEFNPDCFAPRRDRDHTIEIARNLYLHKKYSDTLLNAIRGVPLRSRTYRYSDLPFVLFPQVVKRASGHDFERLLDEEFYSPLGLGFVFNPLKHGIPLSKIVPTETDDYFRGTKEKPYKINGYVHDESAAIMGGVSGNAGLFGSARDLGVVMQMLLNGGVYDQRRYLIPGVIAEFTRQQYPLTKNRRGLGFDRPLPGNDTLSFDDSYPVPSASQRSFGHTGFTGPIVWADPESGLIFVFLCNRVTPSRDNPAFTKSQARYRLQEAVYEAMRRFEAEAACGNIEAAKRTAASPALQDITAVR